MSGKRAVGKVESCHIHPRPHEPFNHKGGGGRRTEGRYYPGFSLKISCLVHKIIISSFHDLAGDEVFDIFKGKRGNLKIKSQISNMFSGMVTADIRAKR
jgi:hypothetical protein